MPDQPQSHFDRFLRPILASRFITISATIHLLIILLFGSKVLFNRYVEPPDFQASGDAGSTDIAPAPPVPPPDSNLPPAPSMGAPPPPAAASMMALTSLNTTNASFTMPVPDIAPPTIGTQLNTQTQQFSNGTSVELPHQMSGRGAGNREGIGQRYGELPEAEQSVLRALRWLQSQQHSDGSWGSNKYRGGFTGLALLCFLGHGETPQTSREFGVVVSNAITFLANEANRNGGRMSFCHDFDEQDSPYQHGICTYALCEAYTMTKDPKLIPIVQEAVGYIVKGQRDDGGWAYNYDLTGGETKYGPKSDTSVSGWQIQALKAAHLTGLPGMDAEVRPVLDKSMKNLDRVFNERDGTFGYRKSGDRTYTLTGVGVLSKLFWLGRPDHTVHEGIKNMESRDLNYGGADCNLYTWYYNTQACFQAQGGAWDWWNTRFQKQLTQIQSGDGSWPPTGGKEVTGDYSKDTGGDGPVYRTTLCCLMLEVFYRYLPTMSDTGGVSEDEGL